MTSLALVDELAARGVHAVLAHPERHAGADFEDRLRVLTGRGALIQWTADFVARAGAGDLVLKYASTGLVHLLGSDAHSARAGRPVRLAAGVASCAGLLTGAGRMDRAGSAAGDSGRLGVRQPSLVTLSSTGSSADALGQLFNHLA